MKNPIVPRGSPQFNLRLPEELRDRVNRAASRNGRSINTEIVSRLIASFEMEEGDSTVEVVRQAIGPQLDRILSILEKK